MNGTLSAHPVVLIGAGIFATIGTAAAGDAVRPGAGPALMLSFVITAAVCALTALCYAEFASMVPISGSAYTYSYTTLGELLAWIIGWDLIIEYAVGNIAVAISWANYFKTFVEGFGIVIPDWMSMDYRTASRIVDADGVQTVLRGAPHILGVPFIFNFLAVGIVMAITLVLIWGIRESARFTAVVVGVKIVVLTFFIVVGLYWVRPENWTPFAFILVCAGIMVMRHREPERRRPFKVPGGYVIPALGILSCLYLVWYLPPTSWMRFAAWLNLGLAVYIGYGCVHSRMTGRATSTDDAAFDRGTAAEGTRLHPPAFMILPLLIYAAWVGPMLARVAVIEVVDVGFLLLLLVA